MNSHEQRSAADAVGFFTVAKLLAILVPTLLAAGMLNALVVKGIVNSIVEEKMQAFAVAKIEYDVRRAETDRALLRLEQTDVRVSQQLSDLDTRIRQLDADLRLIRERQDQVRARLHMTNGTP